MNHSAPCTDLRGFSADDTKELKQVISESWGEFQSQFLDWPQFESRLLDIERLAEQLELIVATRERSTVAFVGFSAPGMPKADFFEQEWAAIRMLSVRPSARNLGIGRLLSEECIRRAKAANASVIGLHTSPIMRQALQLYRSLGFEHVRELSPTFGVPYGLYTMRI